MIPNLIRIDRPRLYPVLIPGDYVLILNPLYGHKHKTGRVMKRGNYGLDVLLNNRGYVVWFPRTAVTLLGRTHA